MTLQQIDAALAAWNNRLAAMAENLLELQADPTYRSLTGGAGTARSPLSGETAARVQPILSGMSDLFAHFALLHQTIQRATSLRQHVPALFGVEAKLTEIEHVLFSRSIELPEIELPFRDRTLLGPLHAARYVSPEELVAPMAQAFSAARDAVGMVSRASEELAAGLTRSEGQLRWLAAQPAASVPLAAANERREAMHTLDSIQNTAGSDPVGTLRVLQAKLAPMIARLSQRVEADEALRQAHLDARAELEALAREHAATVAAAAESRAKIAGGEHLPAPIAQAQLGALEEWLERLESRRREGLLEAVAVGQNNWRTACRQCAAQVEHVLAAHRAALDARRELRGRLDALKAKARGRGIAEAATVAQQARHAESLLYVQPTVLDQAAAAVAELERSIRDAKQQVHP